MPFSDLTMMEEHGYMSAYQNTKRHMFMLIALSHYLLFYGVVVNDVFCVVRRPDAFIYRTQRRISAPKYTQPGQRIDAHCKDSITKFSYFNILIFEDPG